MWLYLLLLGFVGVCESYPNGQVTGSCDGNMLPNHGRAAQTSAPPYTVTTDSNIYKEGDTITGKTQCFTTFRLSRWPLDHRNVLKSVQMAGADVSMVPHWIRLHLLTEISGGAVRLVIQYTQQLILIWTTNPTNKKLRMDQVQTRSLHNHRRQTTNTNHQISFLFWDNEQQNTPGSVRH